jgi:hypothetical protein
VHREAHAPAAVPLVVGLAEIGAVLPTHSLRASSLVDVLLCFTVAVQSTPTTEPWWWYRCRGERAARAYRTPEEITPHRHFPASRT